MEAYHSADEFKKTTLSQPFSVVVMAQSANMLANAVLLATQQLDRNKALCIGLQHALVEANNAFQQALTQPENTTALMVLLIIFERLFCVRVSVFFSPNVETRLRVELRCRAVPDDDRHWCFFQNDFPGGIGVYVGGCHDYLQFRMLL